MRPMFFLFVLALTLFNCSPSANVETSASQDEAKAIAVKEKYKVAVKDSIPSIRSQMLRERSRQKDDINHDFPFDIPLEDISKKVTSSAEILTNRQKPTILLFWLTTCYPCKLEMQAIAKKYKQWQEEEDFNLVAISTDWDKHFPAFVKQVEMNDWPWEAYRDVNREFRKILPGELNGLPQTFIFDKDGTIAYHSRKYRTGDEDKLFDKIKSLNRN